MARFVEMDELVTISKQMEEDIGPVIFVNKFNVNPVDVDEFLKRWAADATAFKAATWIHFGSITQGYCGQRYIHQLCRLGVHCAPQKDCKQRQRTSQTI